MRKLSEQRAVEMVESLHVSVLMAEAQMRFLSATGKRLRQLVRKNKVKKGEKISRVLSLSAFFYFKAQSLAT